MSVPVRRRSAAVIGGVAAALLLAACGSSSDNGSSGSASATPSNTDPACADYATYGTEELSASVLATLERTGTSACLMANHGVLATGPDLDAALATAVEIEWVARVWRLAKGHGEAVHILDGAEMARVAARLRDYGQPAAERGA